jgi:flagellar basal-body rod protein FlgB
MIEALFNQSNYVAMKKMLDVTAIRSEAIASNIANVETPGYQRIDVSPSFQRELQRAISSSSPQQISQLTPRLEVDLNAVARTRDGNSVQLENELLLLNQNSMEHQVETQFITSAMLKLRQAITGRSL